MDCVKKYRDFFFYVKMFFNCCVFSFESTVTMVLFLIGISIAVTNSSHGNQTSGNCGNDFIIFIIINVIKTEKAEFGSIKSQPCIL